MVLGPIEWVSRIGHTAKRNLAKDEIREWMVGKLKNFDAGYSSNVLPTMPWCIVWSCKIMTRDKWFSLPFCFPLLGACQDRWPEWTASSLSSFSWGVSCRVLTQFGTFSRIHFRIKRGGVAVTYTCFLYISSQNVSAHIGYHQVCLE
jgi:hypothetical protein